MCCTLGKKRTARFLCPKQKNILEMLHIIHHSQLWYIRINTRQDVPWPGMNPVAGEKAERRLLWEHQAGDRSEKAAPNPPEEQRRSWASFRWSWAPFKWILLRPKLGQEIQTGPGGFRKVFCPWLLSCLWPSVFFSQFTWKQHLFLHFALRKQSS